MMKLERILAVLAVLLLTALPAVADDPLPELPGIPAADEVRLAEAANAPGSALIFTNPTDAAIWPMVPAEEDGFVCLTSTNWGADDSVSAVYTHVTAVEGDVLSFSVKTSAEVGFDLMQLSVNGEVVKVFSGESGWRQYAYAFPAAGEYDVAFLYSKDSVSAAGSDAAYIRDVQLLSGDAAAAAVAANPVYPVGAGRALTVVSPDAQELLFDDPTFALTGVYGLAQYYIVPSGEAQLLATLDPGVDPDGAYAYVSFSQTEVVSLASCVSDAGYGFSVDLSAGMTTVSLVPARDAGAFELRTVVCFPSAAHVDEFMKMLQGNGYQVNGWQYLQQERAVLTVIDQHGEFLEGVTVSILTGDGIELLSSDSEGAISFAMEAEQTYVVHIVDAPDGYAFDPERAWTVDAATPEVILDVTRLEN